VSARRATGGGRAGGGGRRGGGGGARGAGGTYSGLGDIEPAGLREDTSVLGRVGAQIDLVITAVWDLR
jgi:hypothetical protein